MSTQSPTITVVIPALNESKNLPGCLAAIGNDFASEIVVIDSGSKDNTTEIARDFGAKVLHFKWDGQYPKKRNWFLINHSPSTQWVLFLDADEYITAEFKSEINRKLNGESHTGYWLHYAIYFMGKRLKGGYPLKKLALFKVGAGLYERIDEERWSKLDMEIHEHPVLQGTQGVLTSKIDHRDFRGIESYVAKHDDYAAWEAARFLKISSDKNLQQSWTWKQKLKYRLMRSVWIGPVFFLGSYFLMGGFRDGKIGFSFALMKMSYFNQIYCRISEMQAENDDL